MFRPSATFTVNSFCRFCVNLLTNTLTYNHSLPPEELDFLVLFVFWFLLDPGKSWSEHRSCAGSVLSCAVNVDNARTVHTVHQYPRVDVERCFLIQGLGSFWVRSSLRSLSSSSFWKRISRKTGVSGESLDTFLRFGCKYLVVRDHVELYGVEDLQFSGSMFYMTMAPGWLLCSPSPPLLLAAVWTKY